MKVSRRTHLEWKSGHPIVALEPDGYAEHGTLPGIVDLGEYADELHLQEKGVLDDEGHRMPITIFALSSRPPTLPTVEHYMKTKVRGPLYAAWTAGNDKFEFMVAATEPEAMKALRLIHRAALNGRAFADHGGDHFYSLRIVALEDAGKVAV